MITSAKFIISATNFSQSPHFALSEVAFLGRSNVGKSSLINALTRQKNLAKSSATPGKTRLINFFEVNFKLNLKEQNSSENALENLSANLNLNSKFQSENSSPSDKFTLIFVDLPGFGYAKVSHAQRAEWDKNLDEFLKKRQAIRLFVHLRDARHENLALDESINEYLQSLKSPSQSILQVFTKADKLNQSQKTRLCKTYPNALLVSSAKNTGLAQLENALITHTLGRANA